MMDYIIFAAITFITIYALLLIMLNIYDLCHHRQPMNVTVARRSTPNRHRTAFTLVELLVVIGIIALLISILLPTLTKARKYARSIRAASDIRQMLTGYIQYTIDNRGALPFGYPPATVNGASVTALMPDGSSVGPPTSQRYPWRLIRYVNNVWGIVYSHSATPSDSYIKGLSPEIGLNSVYLGGHEGVIFAGYVGGRTNTGKHVLFKASEIRSSSRQIVFTESRLDYLLLDRDGYFYVLPPRGNSQTLYGTDRWWRPSDDGFKAVPTTAITGGLPNGRYGKSTLTGFFDGHVESLTARELDDMRLWNTRFTTPDADFSP